MAFQGFDSISAPSGSGRPQHQSPFAPINTPKTSPTAQRQSQRPLEAPKRSRSPPLDFVGKNSIQYSPEKTWRPSISHHWGIQSKSTVSGSGAQVQKRPLPVAPYVDPDNLGTISPPNATYFHAQKRTKSPPSPTPANVYPGNLHNARVDPESSKDPPKMHSPLPVENNHFADGLKETLAKAKRLARFGAELNQPLQSVHDLTKSKVSGNKSDQDIVGKQKFVVRKHLQEVGDIQDSNTLLDSEGLESTTAVVGLCLDMCPESEREERERKGDLDKHERLDGDRNQTSRFLAIKKYNRTAEREAELIRPMPVLQKTISYLLGLLDHPYDDKFLGMYNFLWDRMRAIRMDLRMQHIFNQDAITMLEQMIRLHIIAMHELCEYTKGEGFSEGFDAHLNIEQMNKAAVELFQLYDDHRKKGSCVPTEKEFRGYYALLKLDKHLGYKVETSELSLDLAKMTPEIRSAPEVLFARDVARACRTGNFIAFFRLARKATYLQACLMHAHFAKLRTQALASLHSGLQNNQGIPVVQVVKWLGTEGEDIESLLEYHGFQIKQFEDAYMVKDGPFLNSNVDYQTKCSQLVHLKKSRRIIEDVSSGQELPLPREEKRIVPEEVDNFDEKSESFVGTETWPDVVDEDMPDYEDDSASRDLHQVHLKVPSSSGQEDENDIQMDGFIFSQPMDDSFSHYILQSKVDQSAVDAVTSSSLDEIQGSLSKGILPQSPKGRFAQAEASEGLHSPHKVDNSVPQIEVVRQLENEAVASQNEEVAAAKLKLIIRRWKRWSLKRRELREYSQRVASAALSFLSVGMQISPKIAQRSHAGELDIDIMMEERYKRRERSWMRVNVSEVVGPVLQEKNPGSKCICWKLIICSQMNDVARNESMQKPPTVNLAGEWLLSKLMNTGDKDDSDLAVSSLGMSLWRKWIDNPQICCLSIIRDVVFKDNRPVAADEVVSGVSAILFLASESIPWEFQRIRLHNLITSLPSGCSSPLLILFHGPFEKVLDPSLAVINRLGLHDIDKTRINGFSVIFLTENWSQESLNGFFSDDNLREGLKWLANQSSTQPILYAVKPRELVLSYLGSSLESLDHKEICEVGPNDCILAFNEALDRSIEEIVTAAASLPSWPSPEIDLLDESSSERMAVSLFLPDKGWSSAARVQSMVSAVKSCSLPWFNADISWLNRGSDMGKEIHNHKWMLEKCVSSYLTQANIMMSEDLAAREASVVLQTSAHVELDGSNYRIVPQWVLIFRRIFNWRLMNLDFGKLSMAYVPEHPKTFTANTCNMTSLNNNMRSTETNMLFLKSQDNIGLERQHKSHHVRTGLSLDDMIEVSCRPLFDRPETVAEFIQTTPSSTDHDRSAVSVTGRECPGDGEDVRGYVETDTGSLSHEQKNGNNRSKEPDRLSCLLEKCYRMQDKLAEQLAIFF